MNKGSRSTIRRQPVDPRIRAKELHDQGMPFQMAMAVAHGKLPLNEALERMARLGRAEKLEEEHGLTHALAVQVTLGHADLDAVLWRRRLEQHREDHRAHTRLVEGAALALGLHGNRLVQGRIVEVGRYSVTVHVDKGEPEEVHKLQIKYVYASDEWKRARKAIRSDKAVAALQQEPRPRPQDRYACSDRRLFRYIDDGTEISVTLLEGDVVKGIPMWFSQYEVGLSVRGDVEIAVFRHAFHNVGR